MFDLATEILGVKSTPIAVNNVANVNDLIILKFINNTPQK
jgi:hypothetical protein